MLLLLENKIDRVAASQFVEPWVRGDLPIGMIANNGAQSIHGFDLVSTGYGTEYHPRLSVDESQFIFTREEVFQSCESWLRKYDM